MKNPQSRPVLIISYYYPPSQEISAHRTSEFAQYLPNYGYTPYILTSGIGEFRHKTKNPNLKNHAQPKIFTVKPSLPIRFRNFWIKSQNKPQDYFVAFGQKGNPFKTILTRFASAWIQISWFIKALFLGRKLIKKHQIKLVFVSGAPFSSVLIAAYLKACSRRSATGARVIKLVIEFRDAWSQDPYLQPRGLKLWLVKKLEQWCLKKADYFLTTTPRTTQFYQKKYPILKNRIQTLYNGFDEALFAKKPSRTHPKFTLIYTGTLYEGRYIDKILKAFAALPHPDIQFLIYGKIFNFLPDFQKLLSELKLKDKVFFKGSIDHPEVIQELQKSHLLLLLQGYEFKGDYCFPIAGKTFEYLRTGLPILALAPEGDNVKLIREYSKQSKIFTTPPTEKELQKNLQHFYDQWKNHSTKPAPNPKFNQHFKKSTLTQQLSRIFNSTIIPHA